MTERHEPHIYTPAHDSCRSCFVCGRPFEGYVAQPDITERMRLAVQAIPFALPPKKQNDPRSPAHLSESCADE